jgi:hypothetical protein
MRAGALPHKITGQTQTITCHYTSAGRLCRIKFIQNHGALNMPTHSEWLNQFFTDSENLFTMEWDIDG